MSGVKRMEVAKITTSGVKGEALKNALSAMNKMPETQPLKSTQKKK